METEYRQWRSFLSEKFEWVKKPRREGVEDFDLSGLDEWIFENEN